MKKLHYPPVICALLVGAAITGAAPPAMAQDNSEDIVITGRWGKVPDNVQSLSQRVSYADLDLSNPADRRILRQRLRLTARYLCDRLGEPATSAPPVLSCRDVAVKDAMNRVGTIEEHFAPRGTAWAAGTRWRPPYPADWEKTYP
jgi:UrcA family protein